MNRIKVLYYDRIDISEGIDVDKESTSKQFIICCYWRFSNEEFKLQKTVCNGCHDLLIKSVTLSDIDITFTVLIIIVLLREIV